MSNWIRSGSLMVLILALIASKTRADCLGGHLENFSFSGSLIVDRNFFCHQLEPVNDNGGNVECPNTCCDKKDCFSCQGPEASYSVNTSANGYTITAHATVNPSLGTSQFASAVIRVQPTEVGGEVSCTFDGAHKEVIDGVVTVTPLHGENLGSDHALVCNASGTITPGAVTCTLTVSCTPTVSSATRSWVNASGGSYQTASNWDSGCVPAHDPPQRSDTALFQLSAGGADIPISGSNATAGQWRVSNSSVAFSGSGHVFSTSSTDPSLRILQGGQLRLANASSFESVHTGIGTSPGQTIDSKLEVKGAQWTNAESTRIGRGTLAVTDSATASTGSLLVGSAAGPGTVRVADANTTLDINNSLVVGDTHPGTLNIENGTVSSLSSTVGAIIGKSAAGTVEVGGGAGVIAGLETASDLIVGDGAGGRLDIGTSGQVGVARDLLINGFGASPGGEVVVDGDGSTAVLSVGRELIVRANDLQELLILGGGIVQAQQLTIGFGQLRTGAADVTLRGTGAGNGAIALIVTDTAEDPGPVGLTRVGSTSPGLLTIQDGREASLRGGLRIGLGAQGIVLVSSLNALPQEFAKLKVTGETIVGLNSEGMLQLDGSAAMENNGDFQVGVISGKPGGLVTLDTGSTLQVNGTLSVGAGGIGLMNILSGSGVRCSRLVVGESTPGATGIVALNFASALTVDGNADVGIGAGRGEILLADPGAVMTINGTMTIGNDNGGPGGVVALVDARIEGLGGIIVEGNGHLLGTGTVVVPHLLSGGYISPGLSPGTLTIEGDYEQLPGGVLVMEYAGLNPGQFDVLQVTGLTTLGGRLEIHFRNGFAPADPEAFIHSQDFIEAAGGITGDYAERIYAFPDIFADFDNDGDKDLLDLADFQNCFGLVGKQLIPECARADWEDNGVLNEVEVRELTTRLSGPQ